jgi:ribonuclease P protein component
MPRPRWRESVLRDRSVFEEVLQTGCRITSRNFVLRARPNALPYPRLGIIAAKKVAARSVDRNRGKRLIREAFRTARENVGAMDVTVQLRNDLRRMTPAGVRLELGELLDKLAARSGARASDR